MAIQQYELRDRWRNRGKSQRDATVALPELPYFRAAWNAERGEHRPGSPRRYRPHGLHALRARPLANSPGGGRRLAVRRGRTRYASDRSSQVGYRNDESEPPEAFFVSGEAEGRAAEKWH